MRQCGVATGECGDIKGERLCAPLAHRPLERPGECRLGSTWANLREQPRERSIGYGACGGNPFNLRRLFSGAQLHPPATCGEQLNAWRRRCDPLPNGVTNGVRVERESPRPAARHPGSDRCAGVAPIVDRLRLRRLAARLHRVTRVDKDREAIRGYQSPAARTCRWFVVWAEAHPREVARVGMARKKKSVDPLPRHMCAQRRESLRQRSRIGLIPATQVGCGRWRRKVVGAWEASDYRHAATATRTYAPSRCALRGSD